MKRIRALYTLLAITTLNAAPWDWRHADWSTIKTEEATFPQADFLWGAATSAHQTEGHCTNNTWSRWEAEGHETGGHCQEPSGIACDHWNRYKEDIQLLKKAGLNAYRFSIEWSKIEHREGEFSEAALQHYEDVCDELAKNNIKACVTLHHYTDPLWFADKGGFEKAENVHYFVEFCEKVIDRLHNKVHLWFTFNSPCGYAARGYQQGATPPGKKNMALMIEVYKNLLEAHVQTYRTLKPRYRDGVKIGILKNIAQLDPYNPYNPLDKLACSIATGLLDTNFYGFFTTGTFSNWIPWYTHSNPQAVGALDFIGLNYYSHIYMKNFGKALNPDEELTQNPNYSVYPEGLYRALTTINDNVAKPLHIPIYVTENGIATDDDTQRDRFLKRYLFAISKALEDGIPVKGYIHWSLLDNYEWGSYDKHYGIYTVDRQTQERTLKPGAQYLTDCASKTFNAQLITTALLAHKENFPS